MDYLDKVEEEYYLQAEQLDEAKREADEAEAQMKQAAAQLEQEIREMEGEMKILQSEILEYGDDPAVQKAAAVLQSSMCDDTVSSLKHKYVFLCTTIFLVKRKNMEPWLCVPNCLS